MGTTLAAFHPETPPCHSEPFGVLRINSAKNLCGSSNYEILRRPAAGGTSQNDTHKRGFRMGTSSVRLRVGVMELWSNGVLELKFDRL